MSPGRVSQGEANQEVSARKVEIQIFFNWHKAETQIPGVPGFEFGSPWQHPKLKSWDSLAASQTQIQGVPGDQLHLGWKLKKTVISLVLELLSPKP